MRGFHRVSLYVIAANNLQLSSQFLVRENSEETLNFGRAENAGKMKMEGSRFNNQQRKCSRGGTCDRSNQIESAEGLEGGEDSHLVGMGG